MTGAGALLLLDLDGVVVFESGPPLCEALEILALHEALVDHLAGLGIPVVVLTHRSRREAARILDAAEVGRDTLAGIMAAEDLMLAGLRHRRFGALLGRGLRKSLILPVVERRFGVARSRTALIDDRIDNVEDMVAAGIGLVLHAPSQAGEDGRSLVTFDFAKAAGLVGRWAAGEETERVVALSPILRTADTLRRTGINTAAEGRHVFNRARTFARLSRDALRRGLSR